MAQITRKYLKECLNYDPVTGIFTWKERPRHHFSGDQPWRASNSMFSGKEAGSISDRGYLRIRINGRQYQAHRLAWMIAYGVLPENHIDHINHDCADNRLINLRAVTQVDNMKNKSQQKNNKTGVTGVIYRDDRLSFSAQIKVGRKILYLGSFKNLFDAVCARKSAEIKHSYHQNHGAKRTG